MADFLLDLFRKKKIESSKLVPFGFQKNGEDYVYEKVLKDSGFLMIVQVRVSGAISAEIIDPAYNEPYTLHLVEGAVGSFVTGVRNQYQDTLTDIAQKCCTRNVFQSIQAKELISYAIKQHGDDLEFLWEKFPDYAVWRRKDSGKWYGVLLPIPKCKLGIDSDENVEIIDLRIQPEKMEELLRDKRFFPGWHMNKKSWYTVILDGSVASEELCRRLDESYALAKK